MSNATRATARVVPLMKLSDGELYQLKVSTAQLVDRMSKAGRTNDARVLNECWVAYRNETLRRSRSTT